MVLLLQDLQDLNLSDDVFGEDQHMNADGGSCDVFQAKSRRHGNIDVAVKRYRIHVLQKKNPAKIIFRELRIWSSLDHPNVLPLLGYVMRGEYPALVSRWMANGSARSYMEKMPDVPVMQLAKGIAAGLLYLHDNDVIHADLKGVLFFLRVLD